MFFSKDFLWGVSQSGFQFEMGDPLGRSVDANTDWYNWVHDPINIKKGVVKGDLPEDGIDYWNKYKQDHEIAKSLGLNAFRIGIEWSRIFPKNTSPVKVGIERDEDRTISKIEINDTIIEKLQEMADNNALAHYRMIIEDLRSRGLMVFICLNHFTLPIWLHDPIRVRNTKLRDGPKGWIDERSIIEFTKYAAYISYKLGDIIDKWVTINEPMVVAETGYLTDKAGFPPSLFNFKAAKSTVFNMAVAHVHAYDAIKKWDTIKADEGNVSSAEIGLIQHTTPTKPFDIQKESDIKAAKFINYVHNHLFIKTITEGWLDKNLNGRKDAGEIKNYLKKHLDFIGLNYYSRNVVKGKYSVLARLFLKIPAMPELVEGFGLNCKPNSLSKEGMPTSDFGWEIYPKGIIEVLDAMKEYQLPIYITEHGVADEHDKLRPRFITDHLELLERELNKQNIDLRGYFHWALTDNYEWAEGFKMKFGLFSVDLKSKNRYARRSATILKKIIKNSIS